MQLIIEIIVGFFCVVFYLRLGIFIGRKYGTFDKFVVHYLTLLEKKIGGSNAKSK